MDSLTQIALGSAVTVAVMGRRTRVGRAVAWGAVAGTLPDLDALVSHGDALLDMVRHRAETHGLVLLALFAPLMGALVARWHGERALWRRWSLALGLALVTHPLLDWMTVYGTQLLQPFSDRPYGVGSVFVVDPLYTLPLIVGVVAVWRRGADARGLRWNALGLLLSTAYLGWGVAAQAHVERLARASLAREGVVAQRVLVTPAPLQSVVWRVVALPDDPADDRFHEAHVSLADAWVDPARPLRWHVAARGVALLQRHAQAAPVARLSAFTDGFVKLQRTADGHLWLTDLRMGQEPDYVFRFDLGPEATVGRIPVTQQGLRGEIGPMAGWLWARMRGLDAVPPGLTR